MPSEKNERSDGRRSIAAQGVSVTPAPALARHVLHCRSTDRDLIAEATSFPLAGALLEARSAGARSTLHLGPDDWLLLGESGSQAITEAAFAAMAARAPHSLVDVSDRQGAVEIRGARCADLLSAGCPLDLHPSAFPPGRCTRTLLGRVEIVLWRRQAEHFHVEIGRSFSNYAWWFLEAAAADL